MCLLIPSPSSLHSLSDNKLSRTGVACVLRAVSTCGTLAELRIRWEPQQSPITALYPWAPELKVLSSDFLKLPILLLASVLGNPHPHQEDAAGCGLPPGSTATACAVGLLWRTVSGRWSQLGVAVTEMEGTTLQLPALVPSVSPVPVGPAPFQLPSAPSQLLLRTVSR